MKQRGGRRDRRDERDDKSVMPPHLIEVVFFLVPQMLGAGNVLGEQPEHESRQTQRK